MKIEAFALREGFAVRPPPQQASVQAGYRFAFALLQHDLQSRELAERFGATDVPAQLHRSADRRLQALQLVPKGWTELGSGVR
jgi:hypothetical protein